MKSFQTAIPLLFILLVSSCQTPELAPVASPTPNTSGATVAVIKRDILALAQSFTGQGDPNFTKQRAIEAKVAELLAASPQASVKERLPLIVGGWKQVWGPYDYRNEKRGVDPELGVNEIYQVVLPSGCYYNVSPNYKGGDRTQERIGLLRGEYRIDPTQPSVLLVHFTRLQDLKARPASALWQLPAQAENGSLPGLRKVLPNWLVRLGLGGGALKELYTDADIRIMYGAGDNRFERKSIYVMTRASAQTAAGITASAQQTGQD